MSFGFSVSDIISLGELAWAVYKSCKDAPESFRNISSEVLSLHVILKEVEESLEEYTPPQSQQASLATITSGCHDVLDDLQNLVTKYDGLGSKSKRTWDRLKWGSKDIGELRSRLISNTGLLTAFMSTTQFSVEKKLSAFLKEFQEGRHEGSVITTQTAGSLSVDEKEAWRSIRKELEEVGISVSAFESNKDYIMEWFKSALEAGSFEEQAIDNCSVASGEAARSITGVESNDPEENFLAETAIQDFSSRNLAVAPEMPISTGVSNPLDKSQNHEARFSAFSGKMAEVRKESKQARMPRFVGLLARMLHNKAFLEACAREDIGTAADLLNNGADIEARDNHGVTALAAASVKAHPGHKALLTWLLRNGANLELEDNSGRNALHLASQAGCTTAVEVLLENWADIEAVNKKDMRTALLYAIDSGHHETTQILLEKGANIEAREGVAYIPLLFAAQRNQSGIMKALLKLGADVTAKGNEGNTALHNFASVPLRSPELVSMLLERGTEANAVNLQGETALHIATRYGSAAMVRLLVANGLDVDIKDNHGRIAFDYAFSSGDLRKIQALTLTE